MSLGVFFTKENTMIRTAIILDPMRSPVKDDLFEHIDGMRTKAPKLPKENHSN